jgi:DNA-binding MarR family transcriptional regulator
MSLNITRYDLVQHGRVLATRPKGREAARRAAEQLTDSSGLLLNFYEVDVASPPFLDEIVCALRAVLLSGTNRWLLVTGYNEDVGESLEMVLQRHKMTLGSVEGEELRLLGGSSQLEETLREAQRMGTFTAPDLADRLKMKLPALHQRLSALTEAGVLGREDDPTATRGKRGIYSVPSPEEIAEAAAKPPARRVEAVTPA